MANHTGNTVSEKPETVESLTEDLASNLSPVVDYITAMAERILRQAFSYEGIVELAILIATFAAALFLSPPLKRLIGKQWPTTDGEQVFMESLLRAVRRVVLPLLWVGPLWIIVPIMREIQIANDIIRTAAGILQAWIVINLFSSVVRDAFWSRTFAVVAWALAALYILRLLNPLIGLLDSMAFGAGGARITVYDVIKGTVLLVLLIWTASLFARFVQSRLSRSESLTPSVKALISQAVRITALFIAAVLAMNAVGIDLTALAVFSGAVGVGIGFGLQAIFSNLVSCVIMLVEGSINVGDFVELENGLTGEVREINTRATLITTNDNVDILVPNSQFINSQVTNWTLRDSFRRVRIPFGTAYGTDKDLVRKAALEAAASLPHELSGKGAKPAQVWLVGFGESSLDFELVVWLKPEAVKRPSATAADYNWALETAFSKYGIEIPFPQRDLHLRSGSLPVQLTGRAADRDT